MKHYFVCLKCRAPLDYDSVLYWLGCAISIFVFVGTMVFVNAVADGKPNASEYVFIAFCTAVPWVIGRALRYILAGE